jgi:menaquinone-9 beta-reductase
MGRLAGHAAFGPGLDLEAVEGHLGAAVAAQAVLALPHACQGTAELAERDGGAIAAREIELALGIALRGVVAVLLEHLVRVLGTADAAQLFGESAFHRLQLLLQRGFEQGVLAGGEVAHGVSGLGFWWRGLGQVAVGVDSAPVSPMLRRSRRRRLERHQERLQWRPAAARGGVAQGLRLDEEVRSLQSRAMDTSGAPPGRCDVLVIGAGPAGAACAQRLAAQGLHVVLADQHEFPRDKVCGDALIPDAHAALARMGVLDEVLALAEPVAAVRCVAPRGHHVDVQGTLCVLPRQVLDHVLVRAAQRAGAVAAMPWRFDSLLTEAVAGAAPRVAGAKLAGRNGRSAEVAARWVVLATGASAPPLKAAGLALRHTPTGIAMRGYVRHAGLAAQLRQLHMVWHGRLQGGYGWVFPAPGGLFNVGVGVVDSHATGADGKGRKAAKGNAANLRAMLRAFGEVHAPAGQLLAEGEWVGEPKGAPLRCSLAGAQFGRPGLLATGEAIGSTYSFTGEGIGKALETGHLAAEALLAGRAQAGPRTDGAVLDGYAATLAQLKPRFETYEAASWVNRFPWIANVVVTRAQKSPRILRRLEGMLEETQNPGNLFSVRGVARLMFE